MNMKLKLFKESLTIMKNISMRTFADNVKAVTNVESDRMKEFHEKLNLEPVPRIPPKERFVDLMLVETDPENGELIVPDKKDPTLWGDWQVKGRVSDF